MSKNDEIFDDENGNRHLYIIKDFSGDYFQKLKQQKKFIYGITTLRKMINNIENMVIRSYKLKNENYLLDYFSRSCLNIHFTINQ